MIETGLAEKVVLITGGNSGIGAAAVRAFAAEGARVVLHYLDTDELVPPHMGHSVAGRGAAEALAVEVREAGGRVELAPGDLLNPAVPSALFKAAQRVDVLVNNAAHCEVPDSIFDAEAGSLDRHFTVNVQAAALLIAEYVKSYRIRGGVRGSIINVSTDAARAFATQIGYGASKAALEALTRSVAIEVGPLGINVNCVAPGPVQTGWIGEDLAETVVPSIPLGRLGTPADIANAMVFLASDQASWITGQVIQVAGGHAL